LYGNRSLHSQYQGTRAHKVGLEEERLRQSITAFLDDRQACPPGSLGQDLLNDAEEAIESWVSERNRDGYERAFSILTRLVEEQEFFVEHSKSENKAEMNHYSVRPFLLNQVVDCWRTCWRDGLTEISPSEMLWTIDKMENRGLLPDSRTLTLVVDGIILRGDPFEAPLLAQWILDRRLEQAAEDPERRPDTVLITNVIRAWAKSGRLEAPEMGEGLLQLMNDLYEKGWTDSGPNTLSYSVALEAWYRSRHAEAPHNMEKLLDGMKSSSVKEVVPNRFIYTFVIDAWVNSRVSNGARKAHELLLEMLRLYDVGNDDVAPNAANFSKVMFGLAKAGDFDEVEILFEKLQELYSSTRDPKFKPNDDCSKAMVIALARKGAATRQSQYIDRAQEILEKLVELAIAQKEPSRMPKRSYFVELIVAWSRCKNQLIGSKRSHNLIMRMLHLSKTGYFDLMPDRKCFEKVIQTWSKTRHDHAATSIEALVLCMDKTSVESGNKELKPRGKTMQLALSAWSRSNKRDAPERAEALIREMEQRYMVGDASMKPNKEAYTTLMLTWLRSRRVESHSAIQEIFNTMSRRHRDGEKEFRADLYSYSVLMDSWAQLGNPRETQAIFDCMLDDYANGNQAAKPDVHACNKILKAWAYSKDADRAHKAETFLQQMREEDLDEFKFRPNRQTFNEMITVWSNSLEPDAAERAESYLNRLRESNFKPTLLSYRATIDAWSKSKDPMGPDRAESVLEELLEDVKAGKIPLPLPRPYQKFLRSIAQSRISKRSEQAQKLLKSLPRGKVPDMLLPPL